MPKLILLPGMDGSGAYFSEFIHALPQAFDTQIIPYPCDQPFGYPELVQFVANKIPKDEPYVLLGESFSGPVAITLAANQSPGLQAIILVCSFVRFPIKLPKLLLPLIKALPINRIPARLVAKSLLGRYFTKEWESRLNSTLSKVTAAVWQERLAAILSVDCRKAWSDINLPTLYIRAKQDKIVPKTACEMLCALKPETKIVEIEGPHFILQANPKACALAIENFLLNAGVSRQH